MAGLIRTDSTKHLGNNPERFEPLGTIARATGTDIAGHSD
jgi:hypothetical protein